jgi:hypothetical protein
VAALDAGTGAIIASSISAVALLVTSGALQVSQYVRDRKRHQEQLDRDTKEYERRRTEAQDAQRQFLEREEAAHRRAQQNARLERLRACYVRVLHTAKAYADVSESLHADLLPGVTAKERSKSLMQQMEGAQRGLDRAAEQLELEGASAEVLRLFRQVIAASTRAIAAYNLNLKRTSDQPALDPGPDLDTLVDSLKQLREIMRQELATLDEAR